MKKLVIVLVSLSSFCLVGCGAIFHGTSQDIDVQGSPSGARIAVNSNQGEYTLPARLSLSRKHSYVLRFSKEGYNDTKVGIEQKMQDGIIVLDCLLTLGFGLAIDAATGAWNSLTPDRVNVIMEKSTVGLSGPDAITITLATHDGNSRSIEEIILNSDAPVRVRVEQL
jgi:hypothetical protein